MDSLIQAYVLVMFVLFFFFNDTATTEIYTLSLHAALPICDALGLIVTKESAAAAAGGSVLSDFLLAGRSEEHTSELQSPCNLVCRLLLEKKKNNDRRLQQVHQLHHRGSCARQPRRHCVPSN